MGSVDVIFLLSLVQNLLILPWFLLAIFIAFYIPGRIVLIHQLSRLELTRSGRILVPVALGMVLFALQGVIFGYLQLRFLTYLYLAVLLFIWIKKVPHKKLTVPQLLFSGVRKNILLILVAVVGIIGQNQQFIISAFQFREGIYVFTHSVDDTFWHSGLTNSLVRTFPPVEPGMSGVIVHNYHYWSNLVIAELIRIFHLPLLSTQYLFIGLLISVLLGGLAFELGKAFKLSKFGVFVLVYLQYFASDIIYLITFGTKHIFLFTVHPLEDGTMLLENPPRAFSFVILLLGIILLKKWLNTRNKTLGALVVLVMGVVIGFKVHTGVMILFGMGVLCMYLIAKKNFRDIYIASCALLSFLIYFPVNAKAGGAIFLPFELTSRTFAVQEGLGLSTYELARRVYLDHKNYLQMLRMDLTMLFIFTIAQFGVKIFGFLPFKKTINIMTFPLWLTLYSGLIFTFAFGILFIQPVASADIFNSLLAGSFVLSIFCAVTFDNWISKRSRLVLFGFVILLLVVTVPRWIYKTSSMSSYFKKGTPTIIRHELDAMTVLKKAPIMGSVLVLNKGQWDAMYSYVSVFTNKDMFLSGQIIMGRHGVDFSDRTEIVDRIQNGTDVDVVKSLLKANRISYVYIYNDIGLRVEPSSVGLKKIFKNDKVTIYQKYE